MHRTIAAAALVFAFALFALHKAPSGPFEEPLLVLIMGSLFLVVGRVLDGKGRGALERRTA